MRKNQTFELVLTSIFVALIFLLGMVPQIGYINIIPGNPVTIVHIPVLLAAILLPTKYFLAYRTSFWVNKFDTSSHDTYWFKCSIY